MYAKSGDLQIAYSVSGSGPVDLVWVPGFVSHLDMLMELADHRRLHDLFASFSRLIRFDKRGAGMSDRPAGVPELEERIDDIRAVMDAAKSERAHVFGSPKDFPCRSCSPRRIRSAFAR
jgi:pimeloyl-ACP methyl ester carboxylesterase